MGISNGSSIISVAIILLISLLHPAYMQAQVLPVVRRDRFSFENFDQTRDDPHLKFKGSAETDSEALQITPDSRNDLGRLRNKSGRAMFSRSFRLWSSDDTASFNSTFVINVFREANWTAGEGLAFLIAPDISIPEESYGQWLGLTSAATDGNRANQMVAIEFDTRKQEDIDPDDNHIGLNINSVRSAKTVPLDDHDIKLSPENPVIYTVWVQYNGASKLMEIFMAKEGVPKPEKPLLSEDINLKDYVRQESFFGFAASTGDGTNIQLNCVLKWSLEIDILPGKSDLTWLKIGAGIGVPAATLLILCGVLYVNKKKRSSSSSDKDVFDAHLRWLPGMPREFKYKDIKKATNDFHESMKLGEGGFGIVYKGILNAKDHGIASEIAVKRFSRDDIKSKDDFLAELTIIHRLRHKHLVRLVGWCYAKGKLLLLYDFMPNGSLDEQLYQGSNQNTLTWERRSRILAGVASALHYLHNEYDQKVVHRDLKASNILLDSDYNARLGDFGLARALDNDRNSYAELGLGGVAGTLGYVAPECFHTGKATPESDVFGLGIVVLEVVCGRSPRIQINYHHHLYSLVDWVWTLHREGSILEAVDERLGKDYVVDEAKRCLLLGLACTHPIASERPQTQAIFQIIAGTMPAPHVPPFKPAFTWPSMGPSLSITDQSTTSTGTFSSQGFSHVINVDVQDVTPREEESSLRHSPLH
ncbi:probable L-type lectin-domain containing receptor kinase S.5 [Juglans microcarpa x Juglans regia]|uniref:probable L-type lectin-domain containing receptor kinase S.5 n=1 Tax=Juglans microcarpa x Juglans regia TaxID=2249226 RepID=UPI001B7E2AD3|nr:probable L-type lectin-domain containing receptor kinase S.5 [Juglans microcarpa x Juglans regia]